MAIKKLIEVALPLDKINEECSREKLIRHGHPATLHLWWARRPLAAARAVIWASLVDDPSSHPELFANQEMQDNERTRLFSILEELVKWESINNKQVLEDARKEIFKYTNADPPALLDPFAGGGAIPLEGQRLGLNVYANDINPIAVVINKAMIEIPSLFKNMYPVNPDDNISSINKIGWERASGLAKDVKYYGELLKRVAFNKIGYLYPNVEIPVEFGGGVAPVVAWIWARTVQCPNPQCDCKVPLVSSFVLSSKPNRQAWISLRSNKKLEYSVINSKYTKDKESGTKKGKKALFGCPVCNNSIISGDYIDNEANNGRMQSDLMAIIAEGKNKRIYLTPKQNQVDDLISEIESYYKINKIDEHLNRIQCRGTFASNAQGRKYGFNNFSDYFTKRQLILLTTLSNLVIEFKKRIESDAINAGLSNDHIPLNKGGNGARAYSEAISVYLSFIVDKLADYHSSLCSWNPSREGFRNTFGRQAISMVWDYAEGNPFSNSSGCFDNMLNWIYKAIMEFPSNANGIAQQFLAQEDCGLRNLMVSTDPPYYDNITYSDLSDYFYVWSKKMIGDIYPDIYGTILVPKKEEIIASPYRHNGNMMEAKRFFEEEMLASCKQIYKYANDNIPVTIYYAYKQSEKGDIYEVGVSSGWESMLSAIIKAGFTITGTWPIRTEMTNRSIAAGTNALASSIVLVCRKRSEDAPVTTRRNMINTMRREMRTALQKLQTSNIAPVDMAQSAIGPGMAVFSRYSKVLEADGTPMSVRSALAIINEELDAYFNEQVGSMDSASRFCVDLYTQLGYNQIKYGEAEVLANAKGISIPALEKRGILYAKAGVLHLYERGELPTDIDAQESNIWLLTQQLTHIMSKDGIMGCAKAIVDMVGTNIENARDLAYRLYDLAEKKKWSEEAYAYNSLVVAWPDIQSAAAEMRKSRPQQQSLF